MPKKPKKSKKPKVAPVEETSAQKYKREYDEEVARKSREERAYRYLQNFKRRDLVRECILRGMPFNEVSNGTPYLASYFTNNLDMGQDATRLTEYDAWVESELRALGHLDDQKSLLHPSLKFGVVGKSEDWATELTHHTIAAATSKPPKPTPTPSPPKAKSQTHRTKSPEGIMGGTKKALTYQLTKLGWALPKIIEEVEDKFPEAKESSIAIWYKRCLKGE